MRKLFGLFVAVAAAMTFLMLSACNITTDVTAVGYLCVVDGDTLFPYGDAGGGVDLSGIRCADIDSLTAAIDSIKG